MLFFLSGKFPIFASNSDMEALMEQAAILGRDVMESTAALHSKRLPLSETPTERMQTELSAQISQLSRNGHLGLNSFKLSTPISSMTKRSIPRIQRQQAGGHS
jgi:hypothetical protein